MRLRVNRLELNPGYTAEKLLRAVAKRLRGKPGDLHNLKIVRRSIDARGGSPRLVLSVEVDTRGRQRGKLRDVQPVPPVKTYKKHVTEEWRGNSPLVVGAGPAGLCAAYELARSGARPLLIERGEPAEMRAERVSEFWKKGVLDCESNVLYGEGGAGLFSDGKLTSRSKDRGRVRRFLEILVECGASEDILVDAEPHLGSDVLHKIVSNMRRRIIEMGGEVRFGVRLERLFLENGAVRGAVVSGRELRTDVCVLATGHSARDVYTMLADAGVALEAKPFAVGVRLEMPQERIDYARWGGPVPELGHASFRLTRRPEKGAEACYTFCMCPGGLVIACASAPGMITTNGMSLSRRDLPLGNAAFLVPVSVERFSHDGDNALSGIDFQQHLERDAFAAGGGDYSLPAQRLVDFLNGDESGELPELRSCERARAVQLRGLLPDFVEHTLLQAVPAMLKNMRGVDLDEMVVYGAETRSSAPVRVLRGDNGASLNTRGLYPCGEGSGYAGGIVSSGIDGLRVAGQLCSRDKVYE